MSMIHINRDRQNLGQFSPEDVSEGLRSGRLLPTDLGWREGMETWQPLSTFTDLPEPSAEPPAFSPTLAPGSDVPTVPAPALAPAWERGTGPGWFARLTDSVREILGSPAQTFAGMPVTGGLQRPLTFLVLLATVCGIVSVAYQLVIELVVPKATGAPADLSPTMITGIYIGLMVFMPLLVAIGSFISSGVLHLCLLLVGAAPKSFEATYRVVCYANGATSVLLLVPFCGGLVQAGWNLYVLVVGFREVHGTTTAKAIIAVLLPLALCCGLLGALFALALPAFAAAGR